MSDIMWGRIVGVLIALGLWYMIFKIVNRQWRKPKSKTEPIPQKKTFIGIDVSGSLRAETFESIKTILASIYGQEKPEVILFDHDIVKIYKNFSGFDKPELLGRGGTDFSKLMEYVEKESEGKPCNLVLFTDGYGEWNEVKPNIEVGVFYTEKPDQVNYRLKGLKWEAIIL